MRRIAITLLLGFLVPTPLFAAPPYALEDLLKRAQVVFVGKVSKFEEGKVSLEVGTRLRGDPGAAVRTFTFVDVLASGEKPEIGERYFVLSQGGDHFGEPKDVIQSHQGIKGQAGYCGWLMFLVRNEDGVDIVRGVFSFKIKKPGNPFRTPVTLQEATQLVKEEIENAKQQKEKEAFGKLLEQLGSRPTTPEHLQALMKIADERDKERALPAISWLSNFQPTPELIAFLNKKSKDSDPQIALKAAIVTCYCGDWSGLDIVLGYLSNKDSKLRYEAIATLGGPRFRRYATRIVPALLERLHTEKDPEMIDRSIEALGTYPSPSVLDTIRPFEKHEADRVRRRAVLVDETITRELDNKKKGD